VTKPPTIRHGDWHGDAPFYPAAVVKVYIMAEVCHQKLLADPQVARALSEMIRLSANDATAFLLDLISTPSRISLQQSDSSATYHEQ